MSSKTLPASPAINQVFDAFLTDQEARLSAKTARQYGDIIDLLRHCLDGYGWNDLSSEEQKRADSSRKAGGAATTFCDLFGPEHILPNVSEFLGYFMVRKVIAGKDTLRAAGTVTKKLAAWLAAKGYVASDEALAAMIKTGWTISGVVGRQGRRHFFVEVWNIYPI